MPPGAIPPNARPSALDPEPVPSFIIVFFVPPLAQAPVPYCVNETLKSPVSLR